MRTLVLSDVHGNAAALEAVLVEPHDAVACLGDIVGYGPEPGRCVRLLRDETLIAVQGNHDRALAEGVAPRCSEGFRWLADATAAVGKAQLSADDIAFLLALPRWGFLESRGVRCGLLHATPSDPLYRYLGPDDTKWKREVERIETDTLLVGHTHIQFELRCDGVRVINPGSVGQPKDGDPRAAFAVMDGRQVTLKRAEYDVERTVRAYRQVAVDRFAVAALRDLLRTGRVRVADEARTPGRGLPGEA